MGIGIQGEGGGGTAAEGGVFHAQGGVDRRQGVVAGLDLSLIHICWLDERETVLETLTSIRRAGADMILTYYAPQAAEWLKQR